MMSGMALATRSMFLAVGLAALTAPADAQSVGSVGAVNRTARGTPPGQSARDLSVGLGVFNRERIETKEEGNAQIVFVDKSTMTIGRNSAVTIDRFVYDPGAGGGAQAVSIAKGVLRFVGGGVSHGGGAELRTPTASIGVRGGTGILALGETNCGTLAVHQYGVLTVANRSSSVALTRSGFGVCVPSIDGPISEPFRVPDETLRRLNARLGSGPRQTGGAIELPTNFEAHQRLGDARPPNDLASQNTTAGLDFLSSFWSGNALVQSRAGQNNQPVHSPVRHPPTEKPPTEGYYYYPPTNSPPYNQNLD